MNIEVENKDIITYKKRRYRSIKTVAIFCLVLLLLIWRSDNFLYGLLVIIAIFVINYYRSIKSDTYLLTKLNIEGDRVSIHYFKRDEKIELEDNISHFTIKKEHEILSKTPTPFLSVSHNNSLILKQYQASLWSSMLMDEVVAYFNTRK